MPEWITEIEIIRATLRDGRVWRQLEAIESAAHMGPRAAPLVEELATFLTSEAYVPCTSREYEFSGHASLAFEAMRTIEAIGIAPSLDTLRRLLNDHRLIELPEASYDQGAYIGDYGTDIIAPAGLAARFVEIMGAGGIALQFELAANASLEADEIGQPARRALERLSRHLDKMDADDRASYAATIDTIANLPDALAPKSMRGFDLRDLAAAARKRLAPISQ